MIKVLLIEDEKLLMENISLFLNNEGYHVVCAGDGEEGIRRFDALPFDIVITDILMPRCKGDEVARHVRDSGRNIPIIAITGSPLNFDVSCFNLVINKPFRFNDLLRCIKDTLDIGETAEKVT